MTPPSFAARCGLAIAGVFLITALVSPLVKLLTDRLVSQEAIAATLHLELTDGTYDFGRVFRRLFLLVALAVFVLARRWLGPVTIRGMRAGTGRVRWLLLGLLGGAGSLVLFQGVLVAVGAIAPAFTPPEDWAGRLALALVAGLLVALVEEAALRGYVLGGLVPEWPRTAAVLATSALYSVLHFLKARVPTPLGWDPLIGLDTLGAHLGAAFRPGVLLPFVGLLLVGVVLSYAYLWSGSLPLAIGLHAGWVFVLAIDGWLLSEPAGGRYGPQGILADPRGWAFLLLVLVLLGRTLRRGRVESRPSTE